MESIRRPMSIARTGSSIASVTAGLSLYGRARGKDTRWRQQHPEGDGHPADQRQYQDACVGTFAREVGILRIPYAPLSRRRCISAAR